MKTTASFRIDKQIKRALSRILDPHKRGTYKRVMISAQLHSDQPVRRDKSQG